jgi:mannose-6-phosphate isomerase
VALSTTTLHPLIFQPRFKERVWGGRKLESLYGKPLPASARIGESWEITDRPGDESIIANGPHAGRSLRWLMEQHGRELLGSARPAAAGRFPLLVKILDAQDVLSLQVHPPEAKAAALGGEPKSEMWFFTDTTPDAVIYAGMRRGVDRAEFERRTAEGSVAGCIHRIRVRAGDVMFLPSGRVHALGAGCVLFEIQQNSDTTYRVFDWNRTGLDGKPRELHVAQALESVDFGDVEPALAAGADGATGGPVVECLVDDALFRVEKVTLAAGSVIESCHPAPVVVGLVSGVLIVEGQGHTVIMRAGGFCLVPANHPASARTGDGAVFLRAIAGTGG